MQATLKSLSDGPDLRLDKPIVLIGRHEDCDVQLHSSKISRRHCVIASADRRFVIRDLGSTNGVRINGKRKDEGELRDGDELTIGNFKYRVAIQEEPAKPAKDLQVSYDIPMPLLDENKEEAPVAKKAKNI